MLTAEQSQSCCFFFFSSKQMARQGLFYIDLGILKLQISLASHSQNSHLLGLKVPSRTTIFETGYLSEPECLPFRLDKPTGILFVSVPVPGVSFYLVLGNHLLSCAYTASILSTETFLQLPFQFSFVYSLLVWPFPCIYFSVCSTSMAQYPWRPEKGIRSFRT